MSEDTLYFVMKLKLCGAAFEDNQGAELARILRELADGIENMPISESYYRNVRDYNGNTIGTHGIKPE